MINRIFQYVYLLANSRQFIWNCPFCTKNLEFSGPILLNGIHSSFEFDISCPNEHFSIYSYYDSVANYSNCCYKIYGTKYLIQQHIFRKVICIFMITNEGLQYLTHLPFFSINNLSIEELEKKVSNLLIFA